MSKIKEYGVVRYSLMSLGLQHKLENDNIVIERYWEPLCEILDIDNDNFGNSEILIKTEQRLTQIDEAKSIVLSESERSSEVEKLRTERRIRAETKARQRNLGVEETEAIGIAAAAEIDDPGPMNKEEFEQALSTLDDNEVEQSPVDRQKSFTSQMGGCRSNQNRRTHGEAGKSRKKRNEALHTRSLSNRQ